MDFDPYGELEKEKISPLDAKRKRDAEQQEKKEEELSNEETEKQQEEKEEPLNEHVAATTKEQGEGSTFWDGMATHFMELRREIFKSLIVFFIFFIAAFSTINIWFPHVTRGFKLIVLSPIEVISFYTMVSASLALGFSIPFICYFLWQFVRPGLKEEEWKFIHLYAPIIFLLFIVGLSFGYFILHPLSYNFLMKLGQINFDMMISAKEYARFLLLTTMPIGLLFQLPIVTLFLATIGILTSESMKKVRKWSYIILGVVSAVITPPDFISQLIILIPMIALYEASIFIVIRKEKKKAILDGAVAS